MIEEVLEAQGTCYGTGSPYAKEMFAIANGRGKVTSTATAEYGTGGPEHKAMIAAAHGASPVNKALHACNVWGSGSPEFRALRYLVSR